MSKKVDYKFIQVFNKSFSEDSRLSYQELYLYTYLNRNIIPYDECTLTNIDIIHQHLPYKFDKDKKNRQVIKSMLITLKDKGYINCNVSNDTKYSDLLQITYPLSDEKGFSPITYTLFDSIDDPRKFYIYCYIDCFGESGRNISYGDWEKLLGLSTNTIRKLIDEMNACGLIYKFSGYYIPDSEKPTQEKNTYYTRPDQVTKDLHTKFTNKIKRDKKEEEQDKKIQQVIKEEVKVESAPDSKYPFPLHKENNKAKKVYLDRAKQSDNPFEEGKDYRKHRNNGLSDDFIHMWDIPMSNLTEDDYVYYLLHKDTDEQFRKIADKRITAIGKGEAGQKRLEINMSKAQEVVDRYMAQKRREAQADKDEELKYLIKESDCTVVTFVDDVVGELTDDFRFDEIKYVHYLEKNSNGTDSIAKVQPMDLIQPDGSTYRKFSEGITSQFVAKFMEICTENKINRESINELNKYIDDLCQEANKGKAYNDDWEGDEWIWTPGDSESNTSMQQRRYMENKKKEKGTLLNHELIADLF